VDARHHAHLARQLLRACGGADEVARLNICRLKASRLHELKDPKAAAFMPADVMFALEEYCGEPIYSRALVAARPHQVEAECLRTEAQEATEAAADFQRVVRLAVADRRITEAERRAIEAGLDALEAQLRELKAAFAHLCRETGSAAA
jgi:hypothetical protein